jgi:hypothetical protein
LPRGAPDVACDCSSTSKHKQDQNEYHWLYRNHVVKACDIPIVSKVAIGTPIKKPMPVNAHECRRTICKIICVVAPKLIRTPISRVR